MSFFQSQRLRQMRASWRDTWILLQQFRQPVFLFLFLIVGCGSLYYFISQGSENPAGSLLEGFYDVLGLAFLQPLEPFPSEWYLQIFYFVLPLAGIGLLAIGLADFGQMFFNRKARGKDWQMAVASTFSNHMLLVGLGHLGYRVALQLHEIGREIVAIDVESKPHLTDHLHDIGIPTIIDDATRTDILTAAGIKRARTIILCTQNDSLNLEIALKARNLNPDIDVVIRIFDNDFAESLQKQFGFRALSATGMAAPLFAAAATKIEITAPILVEGKPHILAHLNVQEQSSLNGKSVLQIEELFHTSLIYLNQAGQSLYHPEGRVIIEPGASLVVFGTPNDINVILNEKQK